MTPCPASPLPPRVQGYLDAILRLCSERGIGILSVILFGSSATGGFSETVSDVDLIFILRDDASPEARSRLRNEVASLEIRHGFGESPARRRSPLEAFFETVAVTHRSIFICTRQELRTGNVARILNVRPAQAMFVDRIVIPSIISSAVTIWGENLLPDVSLDPIRRFDVFKALCALFNVVMVSTVWFALLPEATKYAMTALKASIHSCFFCYHSRRASLEQEIDFFVRRYGPSVAMEQLLGLRRVYTRSFGFVLRCLPALVRLHLRTAWDAPFGKVVNPP
jgi:hypothetical protein